MCKSSFESDFSAKEPSLGYCYQIRYSLYLLLAHKDVDDSKIKLEDLDDIVINDIDKTNLYQTKLHIKKSTNLTDRSPDFWKTIRVWSEAIYDGMIDSSSTIFSLITTAKVPKDSFIYKMKKHNYAPNEINDTIKSMLQICNEDSNKTNIKGYNAFKKLPKIQREEFIQNIHVIDGSLSIDETLDAIKKEIKYAAPVGKVDQFIEKIEGWWFGQCLLLLNKKKEFISSKELHCKITDTRELFTQDNLPDDFPDPINIDDKKFTNYKQRVFVKQLKLIEIKDRTLRNAISDFKRAYEQRSKWLRENLTGFDEYSCFDSRLCDYWKIRFDIMKDKCDEEPETDLEKTGQDFFIRYFQENTPPCRIRNNFQSDYLTRGSCHILADEKRIGWHPYYQEKLKEDDVKLGK